MIGKFGLAIWMGLLLAFEANSATPVKMRLPRVLGPADLSPYYRDNAIRLKEAGEVVVYFEVDENGRTQNLLVDANLFLPEPPVNGSLIKSAIQAMHDIRFEPGTRSERIFKASFVFEIADLGACGAVAHLQPHDYEFNICGHMQHVDSFTPQHFPIAGVL